MINNFSKKYGKSCSPNAIILVLGIILCTYISINYGFIIGNLLCLIPLVILGITMVVSKPSVSLTLLFATNYLIMGITRYITLPLPVTNVFDMIFAMILSFIIIRQLYENNDFYNILNLYTLFSIIWLLYCIINVGNNVTGEIHFEAWLRNVRPLALYPLLTCIIISITAKHYTFIKYFIIILALFSLLGAIKGIGQKYKGFDSYEWAWVSTRGAKTHLISTGTRYFSFFTDAANFGCSMGMSFVMTFISSFFFKNKIIKIFLLITAGFCLFALIISGTRAAMAVPFVGFGLFAILAKNWKLTIFSVISFIIAFYILAFTNIGNGNPSIRRMRSSFNTEDASFQVRLYNQRVLKAYLKEAPFGIGIGTEFWDIPTQNKFYFVSTCPTDSDLVYIWTRLGEVGLTVYIIIQLLSHGIGAFILLFKVKNPEIRGPLIALLCGCSGMLVASYANLISMQFPNGLIRYACLTLIFLGPYFDKQYTKEHESN